MNSTITTSPDSMVSTHSEPSSIHLRVPAKINVYLQLGPLRNDGYHDITTVYQAISLYDELRVSTSRSLTLSISGEGAHTIPTDSQNLVLKAARKIASRAGIIPHAAFHLLKRIPAEAGLGGGSADAAATLVACNQLWGVGLDEEQLAEVGAELGEDVPFLIRGMMAIGVGHGRPVLPLLSGFHTWHWVLGVLHQGLPTKPVFASFDQLTGGNFDMLAYQKRQSVCFGASWGQQSPQSLAHLLTNDLQDAATVLLPDVKKGIEAGHTAGALASLMTGAGSTCIFLAKDEAGAEVLANVLKESTYFRKVIKAIGPVPGVQTIDTEGGHSKYN